MGMIDRFVKESVPWGGVGVFLFAATLWLAPAVRSLEDDVARQLEFNLRETLNRAPPLDKRIKVFSYDDAAASVNYSQESVSLRDWALAIKALAANRPAHIVFDKVFSYPDKDETANEFFLNTLRGIGVPVFAASFTTESEIEGRPVMNVQTRCFSAGQLPVWGDLVSENWRFYGPDPQLIGAFKGTGHILLRSHARYPVGFFRPDGTCAPFLAAVVSGDFRFEQDHIVINGTSVYLDPQGNLQPNLTTKKKYLERAYSLRAVFTLGRRGKAVSVIEPGDTVIVLPAMYTANSDYKDTPLGAMEGGYFHVANMNSVLSGKWLRMSGYGAFAYLNLFLVTILGSLLTKYLPRGKASLLVLLLTVIGIVGSLGAFVMYGLMLFWLFPSIAFVVAAVAEFSIRTIALESRERRVNIALEGLVPNHMLRIIANNPEALNLTPRKVLVSVMFVDIEDFSIRFEGVDPDVVFATLQKQLFRLSQIVHAHGGVVDKTLGDGLLAFFGFSYDAQEKHQDLRHVQRAIECGLAIQREWAQRIVQNPAVEPPLSNTGTTQALPLRIGINSGEVFLGNLGSGDRVDITIVGDVVNFAKRLEDSASMFRVMLGVSCKKYLQQIDENEFLRRNRCVLRRVFIQIKHHSELVEAWEADPFAENKGALDEALFATGGHRRRVYDRILWTSPQILEVTLNEGIKGRVIDFSDLGICVETSEHLARKVQVNIELATNNQELRKELKASDLSTLQAEVRWGVALDDRTLHGFRFVSLSAEQRVSLRRILVSALERGVQ